MPPTRVVDTRYGTGGNRKGALGANVTTVAKIGGLASVPSSNVSAVAVTITSVAPTQAGAVIAWQDGQARPTATNLQYGKGQQMSNLAVVPVSSIGRIDLYNRSSGTVQLVVDVSGYFVGGVPSTAGALGTLTPARVLDTRNGTDGNRKGVVPANAEIPVQVGGNGGVPKAGVTAVVVTITSVAPTSAGSVIGWARGATRPTVTNLQYRAGQQVSNLAVLPVSAAGTIDLYNRSSGSTHLVLDVSGYVLKSDLSIPAASTSHYVRNITGANSDSDTLMAEGQADAAAGAKFVLLDIGAQLNDKTGVALTVTGARITYAQLRHAIQGYLVGFGSVPGATIAVATNNDANDWTGYPAAARGADWADQVIDQLVAPTGVAVVGADDIEAGFFSTEAQAQAWETAYLGAATTKTLIYAGSADGCPTTFGATHKTCSFGWTQAQYYSLAGGTDASHIRALPQIYVPGQAVQWAEIDATGGDAISFAGALTEHAACPTASSPGCAFAALPSGQGWAALYHSLSALFATPSIPLVTDLRVDS